MKKDGFSLVELLVSISLLSVIIIFMLTSLVSLRNTKANSKIDIELLVIKSTATRQINSDIKEFGGIDSVLCVDTLKCTITFKNTLTRDLSILNDGSTLKYEDSVNSKVIFIKTIKENEKFNEITYDEVILENELDFVSNKTIKVILNNNAYNIIGIDIKSI